MADSERYGYRRLEVYRLAHDLAVQVHKMSMTLPRHELFEEGSQVRRSSKSVSAQIVERDHSIPVSIPARRGIENRKSRI
ncbi:MAG: four helix bundle protein [Planctomycetes bacterium]|nr:four helix bundle protein [Planctomycetota bacterium]